MKKLLTLLLIICFGALSGNAFGQEKKTQDKKGGFSVGGYDNTRQEGKATVTKRSVVITEEAEPAEKAVEEAASAQPAAAPAPAPVMAPAPEAKPQEESQGNAYGKDKQKPKKDTKSKGKRR
jgi:hypothetical protein